MYKKNNLLENAVYFSKHFFLFFYSNSKLMNGLLRMHHHGWYLITCLTFKISSRDHSWTEGRRLFFLPKNFQKIGQEQKLLHNICDLPLHKELFAPLSMLKIKLRLLYSWLHNGSNSYLSSAYIIYSNCWGISLIDYRIIFRVSNPLILRKTYFEGFFFFR